LERCLLERSVLLERRREREGLRERFLEEDDVDEEDMRSFVRSAEGFLIVQNCDWFSRYEIPQS
jgi:hypothetical protein